MRRKRKRRREESNAPSLSNIEKLTKVFEIPSAIAPGTAHIELLGNREAVVDGCKGVLEYDENIIKLNIGGGIITFRGENLSIKTLSDNEAAVEGFIINIEFSN